jgi:hypothetical protein
VSPWNVWWLYVGCCCTYSTLFTVLCVQTYVTDYKILGLLSFFFKQKLFFTVYKSLASKRYITHCNWRHLWESNAATRVFSHFGEKDNQSFCWYSHQLLMTSYLFMPIQGWTKFSEQTTYRKQTWFTMFWNKTVALKACKPVNNVILCSSLFSPSHRNCKTKCLWVFQ